jgi:hypothetical protein
MMRSVKTVRAELAHAVIESARESGWPAESDETVNAASRKVVEAMPEENGEAWLGQVNLHGDERGKPEHAMWRWDGSTLLTFGSGFVAPKYDEELVRLIIERDRGPYTTTADDVPKIDAIHKRLEEIGAVTLFWT